MKASEKWPRERPKGTRMGRGHYKLIAELIRSFQPKGSGRVPDRVPDPTLAEHFARGLGALNPNFDAEKFVAACLEAK